MKSDTVAVAAHQRPGDPGTSSQATHENRQHNRDQRGGDAELSHGKPKPDQFVQDAAKPRDEEESEEPEHARTIRSGNSERQRALRGPWSPRPKQPYRIDGGREKSSCQQNRREQARQAHFGWRKTRFSGRVVIIPMLPIKSA